MPTAFAEPTRASNPFYQGNSGSAYGAAMPNKLFVFVIRENEYPAFRRAIPTNLADTFDEWAKHIKDERDEAIRGGDTIVDVEVNFDEFMRDCRANGTKPDAKVLLDFALRKKAALEQ